MRVLKLALIAVVIIAAIALLLTIQAGRSLEDKYSNEKSFSNLSIIYVLLFPVFVVVVIIAAIVM